MSERPIRTFSIYSGMKPFGKPYVTQWHEKHSELDDIREAWQEERDRKAEEALKERMRGERSMDLHGTNIANAARKGMPARQKREQINETSSDGDQMLIVPWPNGFGNSSTFNMSGKRKRSELEEIMMARAGRDSHDCYEGHSHYEPFGGELGESMKEIGSAFKNLFNAPPAPPPAKEPIPEREFDPVHPTVEGVDSKLETEKSPTVESKLEPVQPEAQPKVKIYDPSIPVMSPNRCAFSRADLRRSIIMSEVLGKPLALRRGRR